MSAYCADIKKKVSGPVMTCGMLWTSNDKLVNKKGIKIKKI